MKRTLWMLALIAAPAFAADPITVKRDAPLQIVWVLAKESTEDRQRIYEWGYLVVLPGNFANFQARL